MIVWMAMITLCISYLIVISNSVEDMKTMHVTMKHCLAFIMIAFVLAQFLGKSTVYCLLGLLPAVFVMLSNYFTMGQIGTADIYYLVGAGMVAGFWGTVLILFFALLFGFAAGRILLWCSPVDCDICIPFIPFLSVFYMVATIPLLREMLMEVMA